MKVLYIGVYKDGTGWGNAAKDYILAMDAVGIDVVPRALKLNDRKIDVHPRILELEKKSVIGANVVIQHILPHYFEYNSDLKCIGAFATETSNFRVSSWGQKCNMLDQLWVFNQQSKNEACMNSGVHKPIEVVHHTSDISKFERTYEPFNFPELEDTFKFYFIGEAVRRKNLPSLIKAFHLEFDIYEPVSLLIKAHLPGLSAEESEKHLSQLIKNIKEGIKVNDSNKYKKEILITDYMNEEEIMQLHTTCDCFVMPSHGEAWSIPTFDAMAMGKTPIVTECTGFLDYINSDVGWLIPATTEPVFGVLDGFRDLYTGKENWWNPDINQLRKMMREAYENDKLRKEKSENGVKHAYNFSYDKIGQKIKDLLWLRR